VKTPAVRQPMRIFNLVCSASRRDKMRRQHARAGRRFAARKYRQTTPPRYALDLSPFLAVFSPYLGLGGVWLCFSPLRRNTGVFWPYNRIANKKENRHFLASPRPYLSASRRP